MVYPTGVFPNDVDNVQAAVDLGGSVILKATAADGTPMAFNFGPADINESHVGHVFLEHDVVIRGESAPHSRTTISGGVFPIYGDARTRTTVSGIHFDGPLGSAMIFIASSGATITGNEVTNVVGLSLGLPPPYDDITEGRGVKFLGNNGPDEITGNIVVANNVFGDLTAVLSDAIVFDSVVHANVVVRANEIHAAEDGGIFLENIGGNVTVTGNDITPGPGTTPYSVGDGIDLDAASSGRFTISGNRVHASDPYADGILIWGLDPESGPQHWLVANNKVAMEGSYYGGVTVVGAVSRGLVIGNRISGTADLGIDLLADFYDPSSAPSHNLMLANDLSGFEPATADVYLDTGTTGNHVIGNYDPVVDMGTDNVVTKPRWGSRFFGRGFEPHRWWRGYMPAPRP